MIHLLNTVPSVNSRIPDSIMLIGVLFFNGKYIDSQGFLNIDIMVLSINCVIIGRQSCLNNLHSLRQPTIITHQGKDNRIKWDERE